LGRGCAVRAVPAAFGSEEALGLCSFSLRSPSGVWCSSFLCLAFSFLAGPGACSWSSAASLFLRLESVVRVTNNRKKNLTMDVREHSSRSMRTMHSAKYPTRVSNCETDAAVMGRDEWRRVKKGSVHLTAAQQMTQHQDDDGRRKATLRSIKNQRTGLLSAEQGKRVRERAEQTQRVMEEREIALSVAEAKGNEDLDEVKAMNAEVMAARVRSLRDRQLEQRRRAAQAALEREAADARMLEAGRQRALGIYAGRESALRDQRRKGGDVIIAQMAEKRRQAQVDRERRDREIEEMRRAGEAAREEDRRIAAERKARSADFLSECMSANAVALRRKQRERERDHEEAQMMVEYQREKAAREEACEREVVERRAVKEREISEVRKLQQRALDTRAHEDALRARRIEEEKEREAREKELAGVRRQQEVRAEMQDDRERAITLKQRRLLELAKIEKAEFARAATAQAAARQREQEALLRRARDGEECRRELKAEMKANRHRRRMEPLVNLDEQHHLQEKNQDYLDRLERVRQMKLEQLRSEGVPDKYLGDLRRMRFVLK